jgi:hypothetical protein
MSRFFVRDGKQLHCGKHRSVGVSRPTDENRRYKFIRDNMRIPVRKLEKKIMGFEMAFYKRGGGIDYTISEVTITFAVAPIVGDSILAVY